jgi:high-affinity iron transporter
MVFEENCAPCHGDEGRGDGPGSVGLSPHPAHFADPGFLSSRSDGYLFWRISEGKPGTAMPSFKDSLSGDERLALVRYLRATWQR